eukprot:s474_g12.t2
MKDLYGYLESFRHGDGDAPDDEGAHPASLVLELLAEEDSCLRLGQLDAWFQEYANHRGKPYLYKKPEVCDTCQSWTADVQSLDVVKGWTRISVVALFLLAASELDVNDPASQEKLKPMHQVLDRAWCIPCCVHAARHVLQRHIDHVKWALCAFSTEQLRGQRWMIGASPKSGCPAALKKALTVTEESQVLHFRLVIHCFNEAGRRLRPTSRPRVRWGSQAFDTNCDLACVYQAILDEARGLSSWTEEKEKALMKAFYQRFLSIGFTLESFSIS